MMVRIFTIAATALALATAGPTFARSSSNTAAAVAKSEIADLFADYGFAADQRDPNAVAALFAPEGVLAIPAVALEAQGRDAIAASFRQTWEPIAKAGQQRRHVITGLRLTAKTGSEHSFRAIMTVLGTARDGTSQIYLNGYYTGAAVRSGKGWQFRRLEIHVDTAR
ncbi:MAG: nuclear transport factor 2 family protein [Parasphingorhabdus sp.]|nr:nuclear transport factor 2 family protein [Parasphingorhabdus sp.]